VSRVVHAAALGIESVVFAVQMKSTCDMSKGTSSNIRHTNRDGLSSDQEKYNSASGPAPRAKLKWDHPE
jgi:hypothetical protein